MLAAGGGEKHVVPSSSTSSWSATDRSVATAGWMATAATSSAVRSVIVLMLDLRELGICLAVAKMLEWPCLVSLVKVEVMRCGPSKCWDEKLRKE